MADQDAQPLELRWGRATDGRFFIAVVAVGMAPAMAGAIPTQQIMLPIRTWLLSSGDEGKLKAALAGLVVATNGVRQT